MNTLNCMKCNHKLSLDSRTQLRLYLGKKLVCENCNSYAKLNVLKELIGVSVYIFLFLPYIIFNHFDLSLAWISLTLLVNFSIFGGLYYISEKMDLYVFFDCNGARLKRGKADKL